MTGASEDSKSPHYSGKYLKSFISGGIAGICAKSMIAPMERVKIIFQTTSRLFTYPAAFQEATQMYRTQGFWGFYRGNTANVYRVFPYAAIQFAVFDFCQAVFHSTAETSFEKNAYNFISGSISGVVAATLTYPTEFIRTRMAIQQKVIYKGFYDCVVQVYRSEGFLGFYQGLIPTLAGIIPYRGCSFFIYHYLKGIMMTDYPQWKQSPLFDLVFGGLSGLFAQLVTYPLDIVRKRMQAQRILIERGEIDAKKTMGQWFKYVYKTEGMRGLFKGVSMNIFKGPVAIGTSMMVKNILNRALDKNYTY